MEYIRATVQVKDELVRVYCHHGARIEHEDLTRFFETEEVSIRTVCPSDTLDMDDPLDIVMVDEEGVYYW